jgi:hypothetical protein
MLDRAFPIFRAHFLTLVGIAAATSLPTILICAFASVAQTSMLLAPSFADAQSAGPDNPFTAIAALLPMFGVVFLAVLVISLISGFQFAARRTGAVVVQTRRGPCGPLRH